MGAAAHAAAAETMSDAACPAGWNVTVGACLWPKQQAYRTLSVAGAPDLAAAWYVAARAVLGQC